MANDTDSGLSKLLSELRQVQPYSLRQGLLRSEDVSLFFEIVSDLLLVAQKKPADIEISAELIADTREEVYYAKKGPRKSENYRGPYTEAMYRSDSGFSVFREEQALPAYDDVECGCMVITIRDANGRQMTPVINSLLALAPFEKLHVLGDGMNGFQLELVVAIEHLKKYTLSRNKD